MWAGGTFFQLCCCVSFLVVEGIVLGDTYLPYQLCHCLFFCCGRKYFLVAQVGFLVVAGKSFRCYFLTYHTSCAIVSVFWLRREIVFSYSVSKKDSYSVSLIERQTARKCVYFVRSNTLLLCVSHISISCTRKISNFLSAFCEGTYQTPMLYPRKLCKF